MRQNTAEVQVGWMNWKAPKLGKELFLKYQPNTATQFPTLQSSMTLKALYLSIILEGSLFLNCLFFSEAGIPVDGSCSDLDPTYEELAVVVYSALFKSGIVYCYVCSNSLTSFLAIRRQCSENPTNFTAKS